MQRGHALARLEVLEVERVVLDRFGLDPLLVCRWFRSLLFRLSSLVGHGLVSRIVARWSLRRLFVVSRCRRGCALIRACLSIIVRRSVRHNQLFRRDLLRHLQGPFIPFGFDGHLLRGGHRRHVIERLCQCLCGHGAHNKRKGKQDGQCSVQASTHERTTLHPWRESLGIRDSNTVSTMRKRLVCHKSRFGIGCLLPADL